MASVVERFVKGQNLPHPEPPRFLAQSTVFLGREEGSLNALG